MRSEKPILLLEDDEVDALTVRRALGELQVPNELLVASNGEEGLEILRDGHRETPCLILLDLNMPRMGGFEFLRELREEADRELRRLPVVVLTTSRRERDLLEGFDRNVAGYMVKPVDYRQFLEVIRIIDRYWTLSELPA